MLSHLSGLWIVGVAPALQEVAADAPMTLGRFFQNLAYLLAAALFILGLKRLSHPRTARGGNRLSSLGMLIAIIATLVGGGILTWDWIIAGVIVGGAIGAILALRVQMTGMPQMVGMLNGFGGLASATVAFAEFLQISGGSGPPRLDVVITILLAQLIGMVTFTGSILAFGKLQGWKIGGTSVSSPILLPMRHGVNLLLGLMVVSLSVMVALHVMAGWSLAAVIVVLVLSAALGVLLVLPIGGADMPVVVSLLNSYSGLAAMTTGFALDNKCLIISGSLVGASGIILTMIMCKAMNRSLLNVVAGGFGTGEMAAGAVSSTTASGATVRRMDPEEAVMVLEGASRVIVVPGYGMAVAQAQHVVAELASVLGQRDTSVKFAIHPVAGRMPGHMNVLLAEANVPYDLLFDLSINSEFDQCDVVIVVGANDVVNPAAKNNPSSPIYGMPVFDVERAKSVMICKRSLNPGFAGIDNELFTRENAVMLFGDAKATITSIVSELKEA